MDGIGRNILLATFILSIFWESSETHNFNRNISAKYDNRTDVVRLRRQSPVHSCKGDVLKFQCATTTDCISAELECDGKEDCPDGSDEKGSLCKDFPKKCRTPGKPANGQWINLDNDRNDYFSSQIDENSVLKYSCNQGYKLSTTAEYSVLVHCLPIGQWNLPVLPVCQKLCQSLYNSPLITLSCKNEGSSVRCDKATDNTIVTYKCAPHYEAPYGRAKSSTCYDGSWDYIPECIPVCGEKRVSATPLIVNGHEVERGHYPWAVALYSRKDSDPYFKNICGGSLLSTDIVLTAAHCVSQKETGNIYDAKYFRVGAGKYYIHYEDTRDADTAQYAEVALIEAYREYKGEIQNFRGDIALLKLKTNLVLSKVVQPVCYNNLPIIEPNTVGLVTGWGYTSSSGEPSETLKELELPYNADEQCLKYLDKDFSNRYFTSDKLCAGFNDHNTSVCSGDSGGGLVFRNPSFKRRYFIHGIVSLAHSYKENQKIHCNIQRNALFTKVETYVEWIQLKVRHWTRITNNGKKCKAPAQLDFGRWAYLNIGSNDGSTQEIDANATLILSCNQGYQVSDTNEDSLIISCMPTGKWNITVMPHCQRFCEHEGIPGLCEKIMNCPLAIEAIKIRGKHDLKRCGFQGLEEIVCCAGLPVTVNSGSMAAPSSNNTHIIMKRKSERMCEKFYTDYNVQSGQYFRNNNASIEEFPHVAILGFHNGSDFRIKWSCGAALISTRFLLTTATCVLCLGCTKPNVARLGTTVNKTKTRCAKDLDIKNITTHPDYGDLSRLNDIGLVELVKDVLVSNLVFPACLYTEVDDPRNLQIVGWQKSGKVKYNSRFLVNAIIQPVTLKECKEALQLLNVIFVKTQICAYTSGCFAPTGNPVQLHNEKGGYDIVGLISYGSICGTNATTMEVYTRVASYLDWIEPIVWPDLIIN